MPILGTPKLLYYSQTACGKGQHISDMLLCGW